MLCSVCKGTHYLDDVGETARDAMPMECVACKERSSWLGPLITAFVLSVCAFLIVRLQVGRKPGFPTANSDF